MFLPPQPINNTALGGLAIQAVQRVLRTTSYSATVLHFQAVHTGESNYDDRGRPDYLAPNPGLYASGVEYVPNPNNPLKGMFCPSPRRPTQEVSGIYYAAQCDLYLPENIGEVFQVGEKYPKRQDRYEILGQVYYAIAPAFPCSLGDSIACWKIELNRERYPVN